MKWGAFQKEERVVRDEYQRLFTTNDGPKVLAWMLTDLGFFDEVSEERLPLRNYAVRLLEQIGINHANNVEELVREYMNIALRNQFKQEESTNGRT